MDGTVKQMGMGERSRGERRTGGERRREGGRGVSVMSEAAVAVGLIRAESSSWGKLGLAVALGRQSCVNGSTSPSLFFSALHRPVPRRVNKVW